MLGKIIKWDDEKGFGFIKSSVINENIFVHASSFVEKRLRPAVGDEVEFEVRQTNKGLQAEKVRYPNQPDQLLTTPSLNRSSRNHKNDSGGIFSSLLKLMVLAGIIAGGYYFYVQYQQQSQIENLAKPVYADNAPNRVQSIPNQSANSANSFKCDGRQYCTQMNSLEEAKFFIKNCPNTKMDGDNDGEPCESDSRWH